VLSRLVVRVFLLFASFCILLPVSINALPIKPKIKDIIDEAKKPPEHYPPARAGWNGPEEKSAKPTPNAEYDKLRYSISPEAARAQMWQAAKPDWRALLGVAALIFSWRMKRDHDKQRRAKVVVLPENADSAPPRSRAA
jgi:hypothetical protein